MLEFIHNVRLDTNFTITFNESAADPNLSFGAKGLLWYLLSRPPEWKIHVWELAQLYKGNGRGNGKSAIQGWLKELRNRQYLLYLKNQNKSGHWIHSYHVYPMPFGEFQKKFPEHVKPATVKPATVKPHVIVSNELKRNELIRNSPKPSLSPNPEVKKSFELSEWVFLCEIKDLPDNLIEKLINSYPRENLMAAAEALKKSKAHVELPYRWILAFIEGEWSPTLTKEDKLNENRRHLRRMREYDNTTQFGVPIVVGPTYIEFVGTGNSPQSKVFTIEDSKMQFHIDKHFKKIRERYLKARHGKNY